MGTIYVLHCIEFTPAKNFMFRGRVFNLVEASVHPSSLGHRPNIFLFGGGGPGYDGTCSPRGTGASRIFSRTEHVIQTILETIPVAFVPSFATGMLVQSRSVFRTNLCTSQSCYIPPPPPPPPPISSGPGSLHRCVGGQLQRSVRPPFLRDKESLRGYSISTVWKWRCLQF